MRQHLENVCTVYRQDKEKMTTVDKIWYQTSLVLHEGRKIPVLELGRERVEGKVTVIS